jgi:hypothetical protein
MERCKVSSVSANTAVTVLRVNYIGMGDFSTVHTNVTVSSKLEMMT